jgi:prepilin-type N-terminal cleavage/methylation domain-containing protein
MKTNNQKGFTLIEIIAVIVIISILAVLVVPRLMNLGDNAASKMMENTVMKLNSLEKTSFLNKSLEGYKGDLNLFNSIDYDLGDHYEWLSIDETGGVLKMEDKNFTLSRTPSTKETFAVWKIE